MELVQKSFSDLIAFTRPQPAQYRNASGATVEAAVDVSRFNHAEDGTPEGLLVENYYGENAEIIPGAWENPDEGTWVIEGRFDGSVLGSHLSGEGTAIITYDASGAKLYGSNQELGEAILDNYSLQSSGTQHADGSMIKRDDKKIFFGAAGLEWPPTLETTITAAGQVWTVVAVSTLNPTGEVLAYEVQGRR